MTISRIDTASDATWMRAWEVADATELNTLMATYLDPLGPKRGDIVVQLDDSIYHIVVAANLTKQISPPSFPAWSAQAFNAGDYTGNGSMTWTVAAAAANRYVAYGKTLFWNVSVTGTVGGTPSTELQIAVPGGFAAAGYADFRASYIEDNAVVSDAFVYTSGAGDDKISIGLMSLANWAAGTAVVDFNIALEIQ